MRVHSLFRSQQVVTKASAATTREPDSTRELAQVAAEPTLRGASAQSWERARRWNTEGD